MLLTAASAHGRHQEHISFGTPQLAHGGGNVV
jgi:hypothetical protein